MVVKYKLPEHWIRYDIRAIAPEFIEAKAAVLALASIPYQRSWAEALQKIELKREIAGTSRIEGAEFTEYELEQALSEESPEEQLTRSQRQARSASKAYKWIDDLDPDQPINAGLIKQIHRIIVTGCDEDRCFPGELRGAGENVIFGRPRHRGAEGGKECEQAFGLLLEALNGEFQGHDPLVRALALHFHIGAMHPFQDGNGRTARALEALVLKRAQLRGTLFIAMSNYYYEEKDVYLECLAEVRKQDHDLTSFLKFGLTGVAFQCNRLLREIKRHVARSLFRDVMGQMYGRLQSAKKRALAKRQLAILNLLLDREEKLDYIQLFISLERFYHELKEPFRAYVRDLTHLSGLEAIHVTKENDDY